MIKKILHNILRKMNKTLLLSVMLGMFIFLGSAFGSTNVVLANQNPDPVSPGNFVYVNVKVANSGDNSIEDAVIKFRDNSNFKLAQGEQRTRNIGPIPPHSTSEGSSSYVIAKYKLYVEPTTPIGLNTAEFNVETSSGDVTPKFDILVQDANPSIELSNVDSQTILPGESQKVNFTFRNMNNIDLKDVVVKLDLDNVEDSVLSTNSGSNSFFMGLIKANEESSLSIDLVANPSAESRPYLLPIELNYEDALGNEYSKEVVASIRVYSEPELTIGVDSQEVYTQGSGRVTFALANPGTSRVKGVQVEFLDSDTYEIIDGSYHYIGDLNPDDFQTIQSNVYVNSNDNVEILTRLTYSDSYNNKVVEERSLPLKTYTSDQLNRYGLAPQGSSFTLILVLLLLAGAGFWYYRRKKKQNKKQ